jgi:hypothetical protein
MTIAWKISNLDRNTADGFVNTVHWTAILTDNDFITSTYSTIRFTKEDGVNYVPYADLTEDIVVEWVKGSLGTEGIAAVEASLAADIAEQKAPKIASGTPWAV